MPILRSVCVFLLALCIACVNRAAPTHASPPSAEIGTSLARFVFPFEIAPAVTSPKPESLNPERRSCEWSVRWYQPPPGIGPLEIAVTIQDVLAVQNDAPRGVLRDARVEVREFDFRGEPSGVRVVHDSVLWGSAITTHAERGRIVLTVRGAAALAKLFPQIPDSVEMVIPKPSGYDDVVLSVRKRR